MPVDVRAVVNGREVVAQVPESYLVSDLLRDRLGMAGTRVACGEGVCGSCTILLDGRPVRSCLMLAAQLDGEEITTIEGLGSPARMHPVQAAFVERGGMQCGYCTAGMIMGAVALLDEKPIPTDADIREHLDGNICRCTGYVKIVEAVREASRRMAKGDSR